MALLLVIACIPIGFVAGDVVLSLRRIACKLNGDDGDSLPQPAPAWMVDLAGVTATVLFILTFPGRG